MNLPGHLFLPAGTLLHGRYQIESKLGSGGFGITYMAEDTKLSRLVCVKELFISSHCTRGTGNTVQSHGLKDLKFSDFRERFMNEARRLARFRHPGIVSVQDVFQENGTAYYCMEFIEGESLQQYIEREGKLSVDKSLAIMDKLLDAVEVLHNANPPLLHRDIKPANIMLRSDGNPVLIDFGTAREYDNEVSRLQSRIYTDGYSPRELMSELGKDGPFTDVYSLGATLYAMLTGKKPISAIDRQDHPLPSPSNLNPAVSEPLAAVLLKAMELKASDRYQSVGELREAMKLAEQDPDATQRIKQEISEPNPSASESNEPVPPPTNKPPERESTTTQVSASKKWLPVAVITLLLGIMAYWVYIRKDTPSEKRTETVITTDAACTVWLRNKKAGEIRALSDSLVITTDTFSQWLIAVSTAEPEARDSLWLTPEAGRRVHKQLQLSGRVHIVQMKKAQQLLRDSLAQINNENERRLEEERRRNNPPAAPEPPALPAAVVALQNNMVSITGGTFTMGCTSEQGSDCDNDEKPAHQVTVSSFRMGKYEVTQAEWAAVMDNNPSIFQNCPNCPVENVSWNDVQNFLRRLNELTGGNYRLPTEAEWEFAARGGNRSSGYKYSGSDYLGSVAWYGDNSGSRTHQVGKQANELGLYDMSGNVWEWCSDWYGNYSGGAQTNPRGSSTGADRVLRGGSWISNAWFSRVSRRNYYTPGYRGFNLGFRLVSPSS